MRQGRYGQDGYEDGRPVRLAGPVVVGTFWFVGMQSSCRTVGPKNRQTGGLSGVDAKMAWLWAGFPDQANGVITPSRRVAQGELSRSG